MATYFTDDREEALRIGYKAAIATPEVGAVLGGVSFEDMRQSLAEWHVKGVARNGKTIGMALEKDGEVHFCILPKYQGRWMTKGLIKDFTEQFDCKYTTVSVTNKPKQRFVERMGFVKASIVDGNIVYRLEALRHGR